MKKVVGGLFLLLILAAVNWAAEPTREVAIIARQYEFLPNRIEVVKGVPVRLYLTSLDAAHGIYIDKFKINQKIEKGKLTIVDFIPGESGKYEIKCSVFCGLGHGGMKGELVVVEPMPDMSKMQPMPQMPGIKMPGMDDRPQMHHMR
ncbi:MAG: cupredoxin domain-containing protein [Candidatus Margulisiibacteriota bacterium]